MPYDAIAVSALTEAQQRLAGLHAAIRRAEAALGKLQHDQGYWCFELEADCTIPAEYILMMHYMGEIDGALQAKIAVYLRDHQLTEGGWPLYPGGNFDMSCSVKAYYALKLAGDAPHLPHMSKARKTILAHGGAVRANVFTRTALALFEQIPWRGVPFMPVEIMLLPRWVPFHLSKVSYWSRTVIVPLLILCTAKPKAKNPNRVYIGELFLTPPEQDHHYFPIRSGLNGVFLTLDRLGRLLEPLLPRWLRNHAMRKAETWFIHRLNGRGGLGAIFPAMVNAYAALDYLGYPAHHPHRLTAKQALQDLLVIHEQTAYCQPCLSPIWDTALTCLTLQEVGSAETQYAVQAGLDWLAKQQITEAPGDWRENRPHLAGGGWPFQFQNDHYPDLDDTAVVAWAMAKNGDKRYHAAIRRAADWLCGMQSRNGGFASFDVDNTRYYLNHIPFADHGALLDPPTADVSARCATFLACFGRQHDHYRRSLDACLTYLRNEQETRGCWFGRWGTNYIYGTWSALVALGENGIPPDDPAVRRAVAWLMQKQRPDGGWGESNDSYAEPEKGGGNATSTAFQTAWALLGLMAAGQVNSLAVQRGVDYLLRTQQQSGLWEDAEFTAPGFPRVFYLKYHGYDKYFPLWALARYRNLIRNA